MNKNTNPRPTARRRRTYYTGRQAYLSQNRQVQASTGRECNECFVFGAHAPYCDKVQ